MAGEEMSANGKPFPPEEQIRASVFATRVTAYAQILRPILIFLGFAMIALVAREKLPPAAYYVDSRRPQPVQQASQPPALPAPPSVSPQDRARILSAIDGYSKYKSALGDLAVPAAEVLKNVIKPLEASRKIAAGAGEKILDAILDGSKTIATDYMHELIKAEFEPPPEKASAAPASIICSPVFNAATVPTPIVTNISSGRWHHRKRHPCKHSRPWPPREVAEPSPSR